MILEVPSLVDREVRALEELKVFDFEASLSEVNARLQEGSLVFFPV
jgi:hypothetical protein